MESNAELSNLKNVSKLPPNKIKPPDILPLRDYETYTPKSHSSRTTVYTNVHPGLKTPTQTTGKRKHDDSIHAVHRAPPTQPFQSPPNIPTPTTLRPHIDPLILAPASQDSDHVMNDPFASSPVNQATDWPDDEHFFTRSNRIQSLLSDLHMELDCARNEQTLAAILEDEEVEEQLIKLSAILPSYTSNSMVTPVMKGLTNLQVMMGHLSDRLSKLESTSPPTPINKTLSGSIHAAHSYAATMTSQPPPNAPQSRPPLISGTPPTTQAPKSKTQAAQAGPTASKIPTNPNSSHHPSRLVAQFYPKGIPDNLRPDPSKIVTEINAALASHQPSSHMKVVAANFNTQGNLIISTRSDQTASELLKSGDLITPILSRLGNNSEVQLREDKKWFKIQIDAVNTSAISINNECTPISAEDVHSELLSCNPHYAQLLDSLVSKPRWLRSDEELRTTSKSSLVFATTDESAARLILKLKFLAAYGRHCSVRAFQDRPPLTQCRNCWRFDHTTQHCKDQQRCRICSGPHDEQSHTFTPPSACHKCSIALEAGDSMDTANEGQCPHEISCINCLGRSNTDLNHPADARRCPVRLEKYGTVRENERRAQKADDPWIKSKSKKPKPRSKPQPPVTPASANIPPSSNSFDVLAPPSTAPLQLSDANALLNVGP